MHLERCKVAEQQLDLIHVRVHPQCSRLPGEDSQVQAHVPVPRRHRRVVIWAQAVLYPDDSHVCVPCNAGKAGDEVWELVEDDALAAHVHKPRHVLHPGVAVAETPLFFQNCRIV